jgi:hypothetical protein
MTPIVHMKGNIPAIIGATGMLEFNPDQIPLILESSVRIKIDLSTGCSRIFASLRVETYY